MWGHTSLGEECCHLVGVYIPWGCTRTMWSCLCLKKEKWNHLPIGSHDNKQVWQQQNNFDNNKQLWQPLFLQHTHQSWHLATTAITAIWPPPPAIVVDDPQPHWHALTWQKRHADTTSASEQGQWGPCDVMMMMRHHLMVMTHGVSTVNISLWLCQLRWVSTTLSPHSSCWQGIQVPHHWQWHGNQTRNNEWFVIHHCHQLTMAWWQQQHNNNKNSHMMTSVAAASQWPAPPPLPSPPALELHGTHTSHPALLPLHTMTQHNNGGMSHNMATTAMHNNNARWQWTWNTKCPNDD